MLSIKEEHCCWNEGDVKVVCVDRDAVSVHYVDVGHLRHSVLVLGKLRDSIQNLKFDSKQLAMILCIE